MLEVKKTSYQQRARLDRINLLPRDTASFGDNLDLFFDTIERLEELAFVDGQINADEIKRHLCAAASSLSVINVASLTKEQNALFKRIAGFLLTISTSVFDGNIEMVDSINASGSPYTLFNNLFSFMRSLNYHGQHLPCETKKDFSGRDGRITCLIKALNQEFNSAINNCP